MSQTRLSPLPLMQLVTGFWASKTLFAAQELGLFEVLSRSPLSAIELSESLGIAERPAEMLLTGCASLGLLAKQNGRYDNSELAETYLVPGGSAYFGGFVAFNDKRLYDSWGHLVDAIRTNRPVGWNPDTQKSFFDSTDTMITLDFYEAMHALSTPTGSALAALGIIDEQAPLLDLGGGSAAIDIALCAELPQLRATVFDLPHVVNFAANKIRQGGFSSRIDTQPGDLFAADPYPPGYDTLLLSLILHSFTPDQDQQILAKSYDCLQSGGTIIISELLVNDDKTGPASAALMSLTMLVEDEGRNYTAAEYERWLIDAGFRDIQRHDVDVPAANGILTAIKP